GQKILPVGGCALRQLGETRAKVGGETRERDRLPRQEYSSPVLLQSNHSPNHPLTIPAASNCTQCPAPAAILISRSGRPCCSRSATSCGVTVTSCSPQMNRTGTLTFCKASSKLPSRERFLLRKRVRCTDA